MLLDDGVDLHSFQPTADDMIAISNCDLFLYTGGESDSWVEDALASAANTDLVAMNLMEVLGEGVKVEEAVEGCRRASIPTTERKNITRIAMNTTKIVIIPRNAPTTMMMSIFGCL